MSTHMHTHAWPHKTHTQHTHKIHTHLYVPAICHGVLGPAGAAAGVGWPIICGALCAHCGAGGEDVLGGACEQVHEHHHV